MREKLRMDKVDAHVAKFKTLVLCENLKKSPCAETTEPRRKKFLRDMPLPTCQQSNMLIELPQRRN
jgi:hypothetical protein